ncbi:hypothetical protein E6W39_12465 [Kitasatospora acidiphila]|uniref:Uncharacterized protein n=1 Tax=Kitasatospora acidiphila TaxID=2567942 RepID=A0A540W1L7_9ACTN|nr:hypothetical protein [Kitasatospora acidiphila]TQF02919.1 hypothetical protein E6W39_12465 [Kitasatospora acidiphila]
MTADQLRHRLLASAYPSPVPTLDLVAAVTQAPAGPPPAAAPPSHLAMPPAAPGSPAPRQAAPIAAGALGAAVLTGAAAVVIPRGRRQGRRPR